MSKILKNILYSIILLTFFFSFSINTNALVQNYDNTENIVSLGNIKYFAERSEIDEKCEAIFGDPEISSYPAYWMQWILDVIKYVAIIALLALSTMDFIKALVSNDKDAVKKAGTTTAKRFIYCVLIFFLPIIVDFIMTLFGAYGTCGLG